MRLKGRRAGSAIILSAPRSWERTLPGYFYCDVSKIEIHCNYELRVPSDLGIILSEVEHHLTRLAEALKLCEEKEKGGI